jgi:sugar O-acyltransferase (sialic acid O-acetyltransferase NeuD family)
MSRPTFVVIGAGGHAKVVIATIEASGGKVVRLLDDTVALQGTRVLGHLVEGPISEEAVGDGARAVIAVGSNRSRSVIASRLNVEYGIAIHPSAVVHESAVIGAGTVVFAGAIVQPDVRIGRHVILNTGASIDHDCVLGDYVHVAPGAHLAGKVHIDEGALMGIGSCAIPGVRVGAWATVGAGGVVLQAVASGATAIGVPARIAQHS